MTPDEIIGIAASQVGYHEKVTGTPVAQLYPFQNQYDGTDNWTKYHNELHDVDSDIGQGVPWCGYFLYWCFLQLLQTKANTDNFLHGISSCGGAVSSWANAFTTVGQYYENGIYQPVPGDIVVFSDTGIPWSHVELVVDNTGLPSTINTIGGNTKQTSGGSGTEAESAWVARRSRSASATTGFHVRGYCHPDYTGIPSKGGSVILRRRRIGTAFG